MRVLVAALALLGLAASEAETQSAWMRYLRSGVPDTTRAQRVDLEPIFRNCQFTQVREGPVWLVGEHGTSARFSVWTGGGWLTLPEWKEEPDTIEATAIAVGCEASTRSPTTLFVHVGRWRVEVASDAFAGSENVQLAKSPIRIREATGRLAVPILPELLIVSWTLNLLTTTNDVRERRRADAERAKGAARSLGDDGAQAARRAHERSVGIRAMGWRSDLADLVIARKIGIGMTAEMVRRSWGNPERINTTITAAGTSEQWVYGLQNYVYLTNGRVTAMQTSR
jgi:hypothetical protein